MIIFLFYSFLSRDTSRERLIEIVPVIIGIIIAGWQTTPAQEREREILVIMKIEKCRLPILRNPPNSGCLQYFPNHHLISSSSPFTNINQFAIHCWNFQLLLWSNSTITVITAAYIHSPEIYLFSSDRKSEKDFCYHPAGARSAPAGPKGWKAPKGPFGPLGQSACFGAGCYIEMATSYH